MSVEELLERALRDFDTGEDILDTLDDLVEGKPPKGWKDRQQEARDEARIVCDFIDWSDKHIVETPLTQVLCKLNGKPMAVEAPTGSGKTHAAIHVAGLVERTPTIIATNTLRAQDEILKGLEAKLEAERIMDLRSSVKCGPIDEVDAVVTNHANLNSRGDWPTEHGRLFAKLDVARRQGMDAPKIYIDEADAWLASLAKSYDLSYRWSTRKDARTDKELRAQVRACHRDCSNCHLVDGMHAYSGQDFDSYRLSATLRPPESAVAVDTAWLLELCEPESERTHGWEVRTIDRDKAIAIAREFPDYRTDAKGKPIPSPRGILAQIAASPGATMRRAYPRDANSGMELAPAAAAKMDKGSVIFPKKACGIWTLVGWDMRPLRLLTAHAPNAVFLSGSWSESTAGLLEGCERIAVPTPEPQRMREILLVVVSSLEYSARNLHELGRVAPALLFRATRERALGMDQATIKSGVGAVYADGALKSTGDSAEIPLVTVSYPRSSLGRGLNLGSRRTVIVEADLQGSIGYMPLSGEKRPVEAIEEARRGLVSQAVGRALRRDERGCDDDMRRVVVLVTRKDKRRGLEDDGVWLEYRLSQIADKVERRELTKHPGRLLAMIRQFHAGQPVTVGDGKGIDQLDERQQQILRKAKAERREEKKQAKRHELFDAIEEANKAGEPWKSVRRRLNLNRYFKRSELETIEKAYKTIT